MEYTDLLTIYHTLTQYEKNVLQQSKEEFERLENVRFTNLYAYMNHLAMSVKARQSKGEFVPRSMEEAQAGYYL